jgi:hypothetical protein
MLVFILRFLDCAFHVVFLMLVIALFFFIPLPEAIVVFALLLRCVDFYVTRFEKESNVGRTLKKTCHVITMILSVCIITTRVIPTCVISPWSSQLYFWLSSMHGDSFI